MIVAAALAGYRASTETKIYSAQANLLFQPTAFDQLLFGQTVYSQPPATPTTPIDTDMRLLGESPIATAVISQLHLHTTPAALLTKISISEQGDSNVVTLAVENPDPTLASRIANAWVHTFLDRRKAANQRPLIAAANSLQGRINSGPTGSALSPSDQQLRGRLSELGLLTTLQTAGAQIARTALPPNSPVSPSPVRDTAIGGIAGLVFGVMLAFAAAVFDRRIKRTEDAEEAYGLPILATIPRPRGRNRRRKVYVDGPDEGFGMLRAQIGFVNLARHKRVKTIMVASAEAGDGKSSVCAGIAYAAAGAGQRVVLVDGDLRRPTLPDQLGCPPPERGLVDILFEGAEPQSALVEAPLTPIRARALPSGQQAGDLRLLAVGVIPPNPAELIVSQPFTDVLEDLADDPDVDLIVVDSPPLTAVADGAALAQHCDAVILVVRVNHSSTTVAKPVRATLTRTGTPVIGMVVVGTPPPSGYSSYASGKSSSARRAGSRANGSSNGSALEQVEGIRHR
jgi:capsular exopolysaccharide synthesis family protein